MLTNLLNKVQITKEKLCLNLIKHLICFNTPNNFLESKYITI